ncbi:MAG TPA: cyclodeaminase/cyclohydrolase family protein [Tepidisphaeraceae bacterium]|jgi:formiminotetrahydrofolate cyclodeaminase
MTDCKTSVEEFLDAAAAKQPTPGGGSVAALVGALAASMGEMVVNYSLGKKSLEMYAGELKPALDQLHRARQILQALVVEDQAAYELLTALRKLPETSPERIEKMPAALLASIRVPETMAASAVAILEICDKIVGFVNRFLLSDLAVCADLAMATTRCAIYNVRANLNDFTDESDRRTIESTIGQILSHAGALIQRVAPRIWERQRQGV